MAHQFQFVVDVEVERLSGKFASRDEIEEQLQEILDGSNPSSVIGVGADGESEYEVTNWGVGPA